MRDRTFDALRGIAALLVLASHIGGAMDGRWTTLALVRFLLAALVAAGHVWQWQHAYRFTGPVTIVAAAVTAFLIISGVSIAASLHRQPTGFYRRRARRILPWYVVALILGAAGTPPLVWLANLVFLQTWTTPSLSANPVVWSLAVEVTCYALAPVLATRPRLLAALAALSLLCFALFPRASYATELYGLPFACLFWAFAAGVLLWQGDRRAWLILATGALLTTAAQHPLGGALILVVAGLCVRPLRLPRAVLRLGDLSYPLYLLHWPLLRLVLIP